MEPHPIPQNVTSFQFHLVGDMTLKQFLYLALGAGIAYLTFVFFAHSYPFVAWPIIVISAAVGAAFAFLPYASRPLDYWLGAFLKAIYSPTKRAWKRNGKTAKDDTLFNSRLNIYLSSLQPKIENKPATNPLLQQLINPIASTNNQTITSPVNKPLAIPITAPDIPTPIDLPTKDELGKTVDLARQAQNLQLKIIQTERTLSQIKDQSQKPTPIPVDYSSQVNKIIADLQTLVSQASQIRGQLDSLTKEEVKPPVTTVTLPAAELREKVRIVTPGRSKQTQLALTTFPNVINGVVSDNGGNYLEGCIVVIHDKEGLPVRALKTNKLGQFTGSTPLPNGTYRITSEQDGHAFDVLQIDLTGEVLPPLLIKAKS